MYEYQSFEPAGFGRSVWQERYAAPGEERWSQMANRVNAHVMKGERSQEKLAAFEIMNTGRFFPAGRTLHGAGRPGWKGNCCNCFVFRVEDNVESIGETHRQLYMTSTYGGGVGYNASKVRPKGSDIGSHKCSAPGVVSFARSVDGMLAQVRAGGSRRAAILGAIHISHPDVLEWIRVKQELGVLENHNISLYIDDEFVNAVRADDLWRFKFNDKAWTTFEVDQSGDKRFLVNALDAEHCQKILEQFYRTSSGQVFTIEKEVPVKARWLWRKIVQSNLVCAEPGILNESAIRRMYAVEYMEPFAGQNPCTEAVTGHLGNCTLGSLNLSRYVHDGDFDYATFKRDVATGVRFLDNVLTVNRFPLVEQKRAARITRRIGLGVMGYAHMLIDLGLRYGSSQALEFTDSLFCLMKETAFRASLGLAREKGSCEGLRSQSSRAAYLSTTDFIGSLPEDIRAGIREYGLRNSVILSIAPTGTIGSVAGCSTSIEPVFAPAFRRRWRRGESWDEELIFDPKFKEMIEKGLDPSVVVGAYDVTPEEHMLTIVTVQKHVDQSISKTINVPKGMEFDEFSTALLKHVDKIKGVSTYRDGSRGDSPLTALSVDEAIRLYHETYGGQARTEHYVQGCATGACEV